MSKRLLVLENGQVFEGVGFGGNNFQVGEIVFNTNMMGYQEVLSDVSYCAQIVTLTYPMVGNYGINRDVFECLDPAVFGLVVGEHCEKPCNWRSEMTLNEYLTQKNIPGIADIDTRMLTKMIRKEGSMKAIMSDDENLDVEATVAMLKAYEMPTNQVENVSITKAFQIPNRGDKVVLIDLGAKNTSVRELNLRGLDITVVPFNTSANEIMSLRPDGIMLSDGPGNPKDVPATIETVKTLIGKVPMFGIGLGHQLIALACGANTAKLKFGHRGANHPVINLTTKETEITSQNHSYVVEEASLEGSGLVVTHRALNDETVEGLKHETLPLFSVQYQPKASSNADDVNYLFDQFYTMIETNKGGN